MKNTAWSALLLLSINFVFAISSASAQADHHFAVSASTVSAKNVTPADRSRFLDAYAKLPLRFEANQGQSGAPVRFLSRGDGYMLFLTPTGAVLSLSEPGADSKGSRHAEMHTQTSVVGMEWLGSRPDAAVAGVGELPGKSNYFIGSDPKQWHVGVPAFGRVSYKGIYPGIDLVFYGNQRHLEYDFVISPGADPNAIKLKISGSRGLRVDKNGNLFVRVGSQNLQLSAPYVYQEEAGKKHAVEGRWIRSTRNQVRFALGAYDHSRTLVVDPTLSLVYSTYLGGSANDTATAVVLDSAGDAFITGATGSADFPVMNPYQSTCGGCTGTSGHNNAFITELNPTGAALIYSTFLGGSNGDGANGIAIDSSGNAYVVGTTYSSNFPPMKAFQTYQGNGDAFVTGINSTGSALTFSSFLGGSGTDEGHAIALDPQANVYVVGSTTSTDFNTFNAYQGTNGGNTDAFVAEISQPTGESNAALVYSTYLGGTGDEEANGIAVDASGDAYVAGYTISPNFPLQGAYQATCGGCANGFSSAFVTKFAPLGATLTYSTFLGGSAYPTGATAGDLAKGIAIDASGAAYVVGQATSTNFPTKSAFQSACANSCSGGDAFLTKVKPSGATLAYSTYLGGSATDQANAVAVDAVGNVFVTGGTASADFPIENSNYSFQPACAACSTGLTDIFVAEFDVAGNALVYSSYLGGAIPTCQVSTSCQTGSGIAVGSLDQAVIAGWTESVSFPTTLGVKQSSYGGGVTDAVIAAFPAAANCAATNSVSGLTLTATISCTGNFASGDTAQNVGFDWGDGTNTEYPGCTSPCVATAGTVSLSTTHAYSSAAAETVTPTVSDGSGTTIITTPFTVTFPPAITTQPASQTIISGQTATMTVVATGTAPLSYQWYQGISPSTTNPISGATSASYTTPALAGSTSYWVQVSNSEGIVDSNTATITVVTGLTIGAATFPNATIGFAYTAPALVATGGVPPYTWPSSGLTLPAIVGLTINSSGVISGTPAVQGTFSFTAEVMDSAGNTATSPVITLTIAPPTTGSVPVCPAPTVTLNGSTNPLSVSASTNCTDANGTIATTTINWGDGTVTTGATGTHTYSTTSPKCVAASGSTSSYCKFAVTVTATDADGLEATASACITLIPPPPASVTSGQSVAQSGLANAPLGVPSVSVTYTCASVYGPSGEESFANNSYALQCNINSAGIGASYTTTLTPTPTTIQVSVQTSTATARMFRPGQGRSGVGWLYAAFLALPGVVLFGTGAPRTKNRKEKIVQYAGLVLLAILMCGWLGCSSSSLSSPTPSGYSTPSGSYAVGVVGTDSSGNTQSTITVGFTVGS